MRYGVDISSNNTHPIAWVALYRYLYGLGGEQPFAIVKISQGTGYVNAEAHDDIAAARLAGFVVGGYLMDQGNAEPAAEEAVFRANSQGVPQFDDDELPEGLSAGAYIAHLQSLVAQADVPQYLNQSEEDEGFPAGAGIWEANYNNQPGVTHRAGVLIHQYTSSATVPGAAGQFDLNCWTGSEAQFAEFFGLTPPPSSAPQEEDMAFQATDPESGKVIATDANGNFYADQGGIPDLVVTTLSEHPDWKAGEAESAGQNPCVGITPWKDPSGRWGYAYVTKPTAGTGSFGPYSTYHIGRDGTPH